METCEFVASDDQIPQISATWDMGSAQLTPMEGFLLSRIDGRTSCALLRQMGGVPPEEVDALIDRWLTEGVICLVDPAASTSGTGAGEAGGTSLPGPDDLPPELLEELDPSLDLAEDAQRKILAFTLRLGNCPYRVLGVSEDVDGAGVKKAYFALSREFHPDCFFGKSMGEFEGYVDEIFRHISEAYRYLSKESNRGGGDQVLSRTMKFVDVPGAKIPLPDANKPKTPAEKERQKRQAGKARAARRAVRRESMERQKKQKKQKIQGTNPNLEKADSFTHEATRLEDQGDWMGAERNVMLALAFKPNSKALKESLKRLRAKLRELKK
ncbi:MAG: DnaJ domain-containing protein [Deltaproteobacteria bacterium]|nr:DnaJ domain-containing protein [Deltaproteobacteria bacterium]